MKKSAFVLLLLITGVPLFAQHAQNGYTGFSLITPLQISAGTDNNFLVDRITPNQRLFVLSLPATILPAAPDLRPSRNTDQVMLLRAPTIAFLNDTERREFSVRYLPEIEIFKENSDQNSWNNNFAIDYNQRLSRRWSAYFGEAYRSSNDPSRTLQNPLLLVPRNHYQENALRASVGYQLSHRTSFLVRYDNTAVTFGETDPLQRRLLDTISSGVSVVADRMVRRNHRVRVTYSAFTASPWNRQKLNDDRVDTSFLSFKEPAHSLTGEYRFTLNPKTVFEFSGGAIKTATGTSYSFGAFGDRRWGEIWYGGGYSRGLSLYAAPHAALPNGFSPNSFYEVVSGHLRGQPLRRVGVEVAVAASRNVDGALLFANKTLMGRSRVDYRLNDRMVVFALAETYDQNRNDYVGEPLSRRRIFGGFEYSFASERERRVSRFNRDQDNVAITEHGRQRVKPQ